MHASFSVRVKGLLCSYPVFAVSVLPDQSLQFETLSRTIAEGYAIRIPGGALSRGSDGVWEWIAPSVGGLYPVTIINTVDGDSITLNCFVLTPIGKMRNGMLGNYRIGTYPASKDPINQPPPGFIEVTEENQSTPVSPHFRLGDFVPKQPGAFPKYVPLQEELLVKLECIIEELCRGGIPCRRMTVMHGFRTPFQNSKAGNARFSRHQYGGAADIFIDNNGDGVMDDLNGDGRRNGGDAMVLFRVIDGMSKNARYSHLDGGLGLYDGKGTRSPFVHVDVRGTSISWISRTRVQTIAKAPRTSQPAN